MDILKILVVIDKSEYPFTVEVVKDEDEKTVYLVTPDQRVELLDAVSPGYIEFDEEGNVDIEEGRITERIREVINAIWKAIKEQLIDKPYVSAGG
jgi:hypothetical protein